MVNESVNATLVVEPDESAPVQPNQVLKAIRNRRSIGRVTSEMPPRELVEQILEAGTWAPTHHQTEPWRFFVLQGEARARLGNVMGKVAAARESVPAMAEAIARATAAKPLRAPIIIAVGCEPVPESKTPLIEEIAAVSASAQNMLLAAEAVGLCAIWRSGWMAFAPEVTQFFGLSERATLVGLIYLGYGDMARPTRTRRPVSDVTQWWT